MEQKANVHIIATGGTIAGRADSAAATVGYKAGELTVGQLIASVPGLDKLANLSGEQLCNIDSKDMQETIWLQLAERVEAAAERNDVDGIVITHGTDTLEETAYFLQLTVKTDKPIVLTGAMTGRSTGRKPLQKSTSMPWKRSSLREGDRWALSWTERFSGSLRVLQAY